jgi:hypothetical protein
MMQQMAPEPAEQRYLKQGTQHTLQPASSVAGFGSVAAAYQHHEPKSHPQQLAACPSP